MKTRELYLPIIISSILQLVGIALFARGFFPYKKVLPGFATRNGPQDFLDLGLEPIEPPEKLFDRLVFIVIDALRRYHRSLSNCFV
jgi:ethanolamine phosphate transferase 2 subunit G